jgi:GT2 family glycosyltransferase
MRITARPPHARAAAIGPAPAGSGRARRAGAAPLPGVSCVCVTYGRPALLEEAIESFLRQEYAGPKELVVLNDFAGQVLELDHPEVAIVNVPIRFRTLGEKLNAAVALGTYDLIAVWTDDDISLPHRLTLSVERFDPARGFFKASTALLLDDGAVSGPVESVLHGGSCWSRELFDRSGGYPHETDAVDQALEQAFERARLGSAAASELAPHESYCVYRWGGTGSDHLSALQRGDPDPSAAYRAAAEYVAGEVAAGRLPTGSIRLRPRWRREYGELVRAYLEELRARPAGAPAASASVVDPALPPICFSSLPSSVPQEQALALFREDAEARISVVVPACNERPYLERTVEQLAATLPPRSEILVVDNGSTDGCSDFLCPPDVQPANGRIRTVEGRDDPAGVVVRLARHPRPLGVAGARNAGSRAARGEVVVFADAHVDVPPGWWPPLVEALNRPGVGIVGPGLGVIGSTEGARGYGLRIADARLRLEWLTRKQDEPYPVPVLGGGCMALRRAALRETGGFDDGMQRWGSEDVELCLRLWLLGYEVWVVPEVEVAHNFRPAIPYRVEWRHAVHNLLRTAFLHLNEERLARVTHAVMESPEYPRALAMLATGDTMLRRAELLRRRAHDDDWFFHHPYFRDVEMELRDVTSAPRD